MEVASPPPHPFAAGSKRHFPGSPGFVDATNRSPFAMIPGESSDEYLQQRTFKRRRFTSVDESMGSDAENNHNCFMQFQSVAAKGSFSSAQVSSLKRCRSGKNDLKSVDNEKIELQNVVNSQGVEIQRLKSDKVRVENSMEKLKTEHDKVVFENKTLKRAVLIQQERQNQAASELNASRQYKVEAEDRIKKLEQIVLSLRYHLQTQQNNSPGNDFMGFRPPDVY